MGRGGRHSARALLAQVMGGSQVGKGCSFLSEGTTMWPSSSPLLPRTQALWSLPLRTSAVYVTTPQGRMGVNFQRRGAWTLIKHRPPCTPSQRAVFFPYFLPFTLYAPVPTCTPSCAGSARACSSVCGLLTTCSSCLSFIQPFAPPG